MADGELQDMEHFFTILPNAFSDSEAFKTSVVGMNMCFFQSHNHRSYHKSPNLRVLWPDTLKY